MKKAASAAPSDSIKVSVNGVKRKYTKSSCHTTKTAAKAAAKTIRSKGGTARLVKNGKGTCVFAGPKAKTARRKRA